jgi:hypothetical protein
MQAKQVINQMIYRVEELSAEKSPKPEMPSSPLHVKHYPGSLGLTRSGTKARRTLTTLALEDENRISKNLFQEESPTNKEVENLSKQVDVSSTVAVCAICNDDSFLKRDQLVPCTCCKQQYHTQCFGARRIPFTIKSVTERKNRDRYIAKHYGQWVCSSCTGGHGSGSKVKKGLFNKTRLSPHIAENFERSREINENIFHEENIENFGTGDGSGGVSGRDSESGVIGGLSRREEDSGKRSDLVEVTSADSGLEGGKETVHSFGNREGDGKEIFLGGAGSDNANVSEPVSGPAQGISNCGSAPSFESSGKVAFSQNVDAVAPKQDDLVALLQLLASKGITLEALQGMGDQTQIEILATATNKKKLENSNSTDQLKVVPESIPIQDAIDKVYIFYNISQLKKLIVF